MSQATMGHTGRGDQSGKLFSRTRSRVAGYRGTAIRGDRPTWSLAASTMNPTDYCDWFSTKFGSAVKISQWHDLKKPGSVLYSDM